MVWQGRTGDRPPYADFMGYVQGEGRTQGTLFPVALEELIPDDHVCRVIDAFVARLDMAGLGFERAEAAETGRPGYDPRDLLKLYLYGYLQQIRSSRRLESECRRNIELMWLLGRLVPDHKTIAEFRRMHRDGVTAAGAELVRLARSVGLVKGEWVAIDGSKFQAVSSVKSVREREALERYLEQLEQSDEQDEVVIDPSAVAERAGKVAPAPGAGSWLHAHHSRLPSCLQRASRRRCRTRVDRGAASDRSGRRQRQPATDGGSRAGSDGRACAADQRGCRCGLLEWSSRPKPARLRASCRMCLPTVA